MARGGLSRVEAWVGPEEDAFQFVSATEYGSDGNPREVHDERGGSRIYRWDPETGSQVVEESLATGKRTLTAKAVYHEVLGTLIEYTDLNGSVTGFDYDALGRIKAIVRPGDTFELPTTSYSYDLGAPLSRVRTQRRITSGESKTERFDSLVDGLGRQRGTIAWEDDGRVVLGDVSLLDARGNARRSLYPRYVQSDRLSPNTLLTDAEGHTTIRDALGRVVSTESELGITTRAEHLPLGVRSWDGAQADEKSPYEHTPVVETLDGIGRLTKIGWTLNAKDIERSFEYNAAGKVTLRRDPEGLETRFHWDGRARLVGVDEPDAGPNTFVLDAMGDVLERYHADGGVTKYTYDLLGRPLTEDWDGDGKAEVVKDYDVGGKRFHGLLSKITEPSGSTSFDYDDRERIISTTHVIAGKTYVTGSEYDAHDRTVAYVYPDGSRAALSRNNRGLLSGIAGESVSLEYGADGRLDTRRYSTGAAEEFVFDADRRLEEHRLRDASGSIAQHLKWTYDSANNITALDDLRKAVTKERDFSASYTLDNLYRLTSTSGTWGNTSWSYSSSGRLLSKTRSVPSERFGALRYGEKATSNALTTFGERKVTYDERGRLKSDGERTYHFNGADRLERVEHQNGATVESVFDAQGDRRVRIETSADGKKTETHFIDDWSEVKDGKLLRYLVHQGQRIVRLADGARSSGTGSTANQKPKLTAGNDGKTEASLGSKAHANSPWAIKTVALLGQPFTVLSSVLLVTLGSFFGLWQALRTLRRAALAPVALVVLLAACGDAGAGVTGSGPPTNEDALPPGAERSRDVTRLIETDEILIHDQVCSLIGTHSSVGALQDSASHHPYGTTRFEAASAETRRFAGSPRDAGVGIDLMGARAYVPELGIWASPDPALLDDPSQYLRSHPSHSAYTYANNNPVSRKDESGGIALPAIIGAAAVAIGITFTAKKLDEPHARHELVADMARLTGKAYAALSFVAAGAVAVAAGPATAASFVGLR